MSPASAAVAEPAPLRVAVLVSGRGSNLQALIDARAGGTLAIDLVVVASNRPGCPALARAQAAGIATVALDPAGYPDRGAYDRALFAAVRRYAPQLLVLAGFMRILDAGVLEAWPWPVINIHPSLLPRHPGLHTHARALAAGEREHGASVHRVIPALDAGPVLAQVRIALHPDDTPATIAQRLLPREHALLCACVGLFAQRRVAFDPAGIQIDGGTLAHPLQLDADDALQFSAHDRHLV
jgi:phosphoribosylglycinamide formyltransferase-1